MTRIGLSAFIAISIFGLIVAGTMSLIRIWHQRNCINHREEVERLMVLARCDECHTPP